MLLEVLKRIPLNRKISTTDLHQQLTAAGYELSRRTLQRYLKALSESDMGVQCDDKSKPFGYRRLLNSNDLDRVGLGADGALLLLLARELYAYGFGIVTRKTLAQQGSLRERKSAALSADDSSLDI